ncbi:MAG: hypothetical protein ABTR27_06280 [Candidatus Competibacter phosphatis]
MHLLKLCHSRGIQFIELDGFSGSSGTWRQVKPIPERVGRIMSSAHGTWKWEEVSQTMVSGRSSITFTAHELCLEESDGQIFSLGFFAKPSLPTQQYRQYRYGYFRRLPASLLRKGNFVLPRSNIVWQYIKQVDFCAAWVGIFVKSGGTVVAAGYEAGLGVVVDVADPSQRRLIGLETGRLGAGLGGSIGAAIGILTGFPNANSMKGHVQEGWDFSFAFEERWDTYLRSIQSVQSVDRVAKFFGEARALGGLAKASKNIKPELASAASSMAKGGDIYKICDTGSGTFVDDKPNIALLDLPGGKGLELGVFATSTRVVDVQGI